MSNNQKFEQASDAEKRVMIAEDAITQLIARRFLAKPGTWAIIYCPDSQSETSLQKILDDSNKSIKCTCCGIGSLFLSQVRIENQYEISRENTGNYSMYDYDMCPTLEKYFSREQLDLIEVAFEGRSATYSVPRRAGCHTKYINGRYVSGYNNEEDYIKAVDFYCRLNDTGERLMTILNNIVKNKGTFVP